MSVSGIGSASFPSARLRLPAQNAASQGASGPGAQPPHSGDGATSAHARPSGERADTSGTPQASGRSTGASAARGQIAGGLTAEQLVELDRLKARDTEVRQHEAAHQGAGGAYTGSASFTFTRGPDGKRYATGGEVSVDTSPIPGKPEDTIAKMRILQQAALAPAEPSPQDRRVAAQAARAMHQAQSELQQQDRAQAHASAGDDGSRQRRLAHAAGAYRETEKASAA
ncbi:hypothetical protein H9L17_15530 [Thermomonas brevis]|uniref:SprA-related family protein n=1 Tax=Thermomonas brevis TaxID=215691 RepID=A0A7G9QT72_9GAMM|nr:putative metalloprotease CJM1_0395 family protein [Thermomonas brevis]QNN46547.1 hypothetical protein H9L17_15530 [Thermomonas brevis]